MIGMKTANSTRKMAAVVVAYLISLRALKSMEAPAVSLRGSRVFMRRQASVQRMAHKSAIMRMAHGNPILGAANSIIMGNITPPSPPAVQAMPVA